MCIFRCSPLADAAAKKKKKKKKGTALPAQVEMSGQQHADRQSLGTTVELAGPANRGEFRPAGGLPGQLTLMLDAEFRAQTLGCRTRSV